MKSQFFTSLEQSRELVSLGIDLNTADMHFHYYGKEYQLIPHIGDAVHYFGCVHDEPCWSTNALLKLTSPESNLRHCFDDSWECYWPQHYKTSRHKNCFDAVYDMIKWKLTNSIKHGLDN